MEFQHFPEPRPEPDEEGPTYTCEVCGEPISALTREAPRGTSARNSVTTCACGARYRWDNWALNRWKGDTGTAFGPRREQ